MASLLIWQNAGGNVDLAKVLAASEALTKLILERDEHSKRREDDWKATRDWLWKVALQQRAIGKAEHETEIEQLRSEIKRKDSEIAHLRAVLDGPMLTLPSNPNPNPPAGSNGPASSSPPPSQAAPKNAPVLAASGGEAKRRMAAVNADRGIDYRVMGGPGRWFEPQPSGGGGSWRDYVSADGSIRATPRGNEDDTCTPSTKTTRPTMKSARHLQAWLRPLSTVTRICPRAVRIAPG